MPVIVDESAFQVHLTYATPFALVPESARFCYAPVGESKGEEKDINTAKALIRHDHGEPQECSLFVFDLYLPEFVIKQFNRHRVGVGRCENSLRYQKLEEIKLYFSREEWDRQPISVAVALTLVDALVELMQDHQTTKREREQWQRLMPRNTMTHQRLWLNFRALTHFLKKRMAKDAQLEAQWAAKMMYTEIRTYDPSGWGALLTAWSDWAGITVEEGN